MGFGWHMGAFQFDFLGEGGDCALGFSEFRRVISSFVLFVFLEALDFYFYFLKILNG